MDDCLAFVVQADDGQSLEVHLGVCVKKFDRAKGSKKREEGHQKRLRLMRLHAVIFVLLPDQLAQSFFPDMVRYLAAHYELTVKLAKQLQYDKAVWPMVGIHLVARTMSANDIVAAVSAKPERLPGGLGVLSIEKSFGTS